MIMHLSGMITPALKFGKQFLLFSGAGGLCGAAIGFLMFLHLGPFKNPQEAGYATGLFVKSGVQLGFIIWVIQLAVRGLRRRIFSSPKTWFRKTGLSRNS
jgi:hypothetical protein